MNIFNKLFKTRRKISGALSKIFSASKLSLADYDAIEECLLGADISWNVTEKLLESIKGYSSGENWEDCLKTDFKKILNVDDAFEIKKNIIMIGVNGAGKTTTCAKLANHFKLNNKKVMLVAADTYRAAAVEQLEIWSKRLGIEFISNDKTNDPASIAYDGVNSGKNKNFDYVIVDTAGRLQTSQNLMKELEKIYKVISKISKEITILINLDANVGQNGIRQVEEFSKYLPIDGIILNKMDGTAKGGVVVSIVDKLKIPIVFLGIGEKINNLMLFDVDNYIDSIISSKVENEE